MLTTKALTLLLVCLSKVVSCEVCYVCGSDKETITNPNKVIPVPDEYESPIAEVDCETLAAAGLNGFIPDSSCTDLQDSIDFKLFCGCTISSETNDEPTGFPSLEISPTITPSELLSKTDQPTAVESESTPTDRPSSFVSTPTKSFPPATSPLEFKSSNEPTELPSSVDAIDDEQKLNDTKIIESSDIPSEAPSNLPSNHPSNIPSSYPSEVPSIQPDFPSVQPTTDRDVSGVVTESSATTTRLLFTAPILAGLCVLFYTLN